MIVDPLSVLIDTVGRAIFHRSKIQPKRYAELSPSVRWRPHLFEEQDRRAWYLLTEVPESDGWVRRIERACESVPGLTIGVCGPQLVLSREEVINSVDQLNARVMIVEEGDNGFEMKFENTSILDMIYEERWRLPHPLTQLLLDRALTRALVNVDSYEKGALLELLVATLLSQVDGFEVTDRNVSSATQEIDVSVLNRNMGGPLSRGSLVLAEAKNWSSPVDRKEYNAFATKLRTRRGMAKLGFMVTTNRFTRACYMEHIGERYMDDIIVLLDKDRLPAVWRDFDSVTAGVERMVINASYDHMLD